MPVRAFVPVSEALTEEKSKKPVHDSLRRGSNHAWYINSLLYSHDDAQMKADRGDRGESGVD